jgi:hypothetical protein
MAYNATGDDLTPERLRALADNYREVANSSPYSATAATMLRLAERFEELAGEREAEAGGVRQP